MSAASRPGLVSFRDPVSGARNLFETSGFLTRHTSGFGMTNLYAVRTALRRPGRSRLSTTCDRHRESSVILSNFKGTKEGRNKSANFARRWTKVVVVLSPIHDGSCTHNRQETSICQPSLIISKKVVGFTTHSTTNAYGCSVPRLTRFAPGTCMGPDPESAQNP